MPAGAEARLPALVASCLGEDAEAGGDAEEDAEGGDVRQEVEVRRDGDPDLRDARALVFRSLCSPNAQVRANAIRCCQSASPW